MFNNGNFILYSRLAAQFHSMEVRNSKFACFIDVFTSNTYVMVIMSDSGIRKYYYYYYYCHWLTTISLQLVYLKHTVNANFQKNESPLLLKFP